VAAVLVIASCSTDPAVDTGPLGSGGIAGSICIPIRTGQVESWGITELVNSGHSSVVIDKVTLINARRVRLAASYVVPITGNLEFGSWFGYPPAPRQKGVEWSQHAVANGARVAPHRGPRHADLVVVLRPTGSGAQVQAIRVAYQEANNRFLLQTHYRILFLVGKKRVRPTSRSSTQIRCHSAEWCARPSEGHASTGDSARAPSVVGDRRPEVAGARRRKRSRPCLRPCER
jgi:hypothetical protein